jgi:hypothetical protein
VSVYLDASVLVAMFTPDALPSRAKAFLRTRSPTLISGRRASTWTKVFVG